jgi:hypothetical protein
MERLAAVLSVLLLGACGKSEDKPGGPPSEKSTVVEHAATGAVVADPGPPPESMPPPAREAFDKMMPVYDEYAAAVTAAAGDCPKIAAAMKAVTSRRSVEIAGWKEFRMQIDNDPASLAWFKKAYLPRYDATVEAMHAAVRPCLSTSAEMASAIYEAPLPRQW